MNLESTLFLIGIVAYLITQLLFIYREKFVIDRNYEAFREEIEYWKKELSNKNKDLQVLMDVVTNKKLVKIYKIDESVIKEEIVDKI